MKKVRYEVPEVEVLDVVAEAGFAASPLGGVDDNPNNPSETPSVPGDDTDW